MSSALLEVFDLPAMPWLPLMCCHGNVTCLIPLVGVVEPLMLNQELVTVPQAVPTVQGGVALCLVNGRPRCRPEFVNRR